MNILNAAVSFLAVLTAALSSVSGQSKVEQAEDGSSGTISFSTPDLHDDEAHSPWMPDELRCDACTAVAYQMWHKFFGYNEKRKSLKYNLPESDIIDLLEQVCTTSKTWEGYGLKEMKPTKEHRLVGDGLPDHQMAGVITGGGKWPASYGMKEVQKKHRLSGEGLPSADVPGITAGGGRWPARLQDMCEQYIGDLGEVEIYKYFKKAPKNRQNFEDYLCHGDGIRGDCLGADRSRKDEL